MQSLTARVVVPAADDTLCLGASRTVSQAAFGSLPENAGGNAEGAVVTARGPENRSVSIRKPIVQRFGV